MNLPNSDGTHLTALRTSRFVDGMWGEAGADHFRDSLGGVCCVDFCCAAGDGCLEQGGNRVLGIKGGVDDI